MSESVIIERKKQSTEHYNILHRVAVEADADTLAFAGYGTDEDYGLCEFDE